MHIFSMLMRIEKGFAWGFVGLLFALLTFLVGYLFPHQSRPDVDFTILSETDISNNRSPVPGLQVFFQGEDLHSQNKSLRSIQVRVENTGDEDVLPTHYDERLQWGVSIKDGTVVRVLPLTSSNDYLRTKMRPRNDGNQVILPHIILEQGQFASFEVLVVHPEDVVPSVASFGKIAGVKELGIHRLEPATGNTIWESAWAGAWQIQILRIISYSLGALALSTVFFVTGTALCVIWSHMHALFRSRRVLASQSIENADPKVQRWLSRTYMKGGHADILQVLDMLIDPARLAKQVSTVERARQQWANKSGLDKTWSKEIKAGGRWWFSDENFRGLKGQPCERIRELLDHGIVSLDENRNVVIAEDAIPTATALLEELHGRSGTLAGLPARPEG